MRGLPATQERVTAIDQVKAFTLYFLRFESLIRPRSSYFAYKRILKRTLAPHKVDPHLLTPIAQEIRALLFPFDPLIAEAASLVIEFDAAYRLRLQDLCDQMSKQNLRDHPFREVNRLVAINKKRDLPEVSAKLSRFKWCISIALCIPRVKRAIAEINWTNIHSDQSDRYWLSLRTDYKYDVKRDASFWDKDGFQKWKD